MNTKDKTEQPLLDSNQCVQESNSCALPLDERAFLVFEIFLKRSVASKFCQSRGLMPTTPRIKQCWLFYS